MYTSMYSIIQIQLNLLYVLKESDNLLLAKNMMPQDKLSHLLKIRVFRSIILHSINWMPNRV